MKQVFLWTFSSLFWLSTLSGCAKEAQSWAEYRDAGGSGDSGCPIGSIGCPCGDSDGCDDGLSCHSSICVEVTTDADTETADSEIEPPNCQESCVSMDECSAQNGIPVFGGTCADTDKVCCALGD